VNRHQLRAWLNQWEPVIRASKKKYRGSEKELAVIQEMYQRLHVVSRAVADGDLEAAVFSAVQFGLYAGEWGELIAVAKYTGGQKKKAADQAERREYFRERYLVHSPDSKNIKEACQKADEDTLKEFPDMDPYKSISWYGLIEGLPRP